MNATAQPSLTSRLSGRRLPGFRFAETMTGFVWMDGVRREMEFRVRAEAPDAREHLRTGRTDLLGTVHIEGLCEEAPLHGTLHIDLPRRIRYEFAFRDDGGRALRFVGQKDLSLLRPFQTISRLPGEVKDEAGRTVGYAQLRFRWRTLPAFLGSFRPLL
jgi:hypothetical protein